MFIHPLNICSPYNFRSYIFYVGIPFDVMLFDVSCGCMRLGW